tara:strand:- start:2344 stop:2844 length:501 start_codon:yes stop_codon:yes gene_type:complete
MDNQPIAMPRNYTNFWAAEFDDWITQDDFIINFGPVTYVRPSHSKTYLFKNDSILELNKPYPHVDSPYLIRVYAEFNISEGWLEIVDFESVTPYYPGCESYEDDVYLGEIEIVSKLKNRLLTHFWEVSDDEGDSGDWSQGDDEEFPLDRWGRLDDDYAYGAEVSRP